jgi:hypothetical protein
MAGGLKNRIRHGDTLYLKPSEKRRDWFALTHDRTNSLFSISLLTAEAAAEAPRKGINAAPLGTCAAYLEELSGLLDQHYEALCLTQAEHLRIREYCRNRHIRVSATEAKRPAIERFARLEARARAADAKAISYLYGTLPKWLPEPVLAGIERAVATLRNAEQSRERMATVVAQARQDKLEIPGEARDVTAFVQAAYYLAHVQWALSLLKADAIRELGGKFAAQNYLRSRAGQEALRGMSAQDRTRRDASIRRRAMELAAQNPRISSRAQGRTLEAEFAPLKERQIRRILKGY